MEPLENSNDFRNHLQIHMKGLTDNELKDVLKKRKQYQTEAAGLAVQEALRRGIIQSEDDLASPAFAEPGTRFTLFPFPEEKDANIKLFRSLTRSLMIVGLIPVVFGVMKFTLAKYVEGTSLISIGVLWIAFAWFAMEKREVKFLYPVLALACLSMIYAGRILMVIKSLRWSDFLIPLVLYLAIFYLIFYARSILRKNKDID
jgi:hypothetical protein